jgi:hypothetical protein
MDRGRSSGNSSPQLRNRHSRFKRPPDQRMGVERRRGLHFWTSSRFSERTGKDSSMTNLANFRTSAVECMGGVWSRRPWQFRWTIDHARGVTDGGLRRANCLQPGSSCPSSKFRVPVVQLLQRVATKDEVMTSRNLSFLPALAVLTMPFHDTSADLRRDRFCRFHPDTWGRPARWR